MKRFALYTIVLLLSLFISPRLGNFTFAQSTTTTSWVDSGYDDSMKAAANGDVNAAAHVSNVNTNTYSDFVRRVLGPVENLTINSKDMNTPYADAMRSQSAIANFSSYIAAIYTNPPASTYAFVQDFGQSLGFIPKQAYAQGIGFTSLTALLPIWKIFRNIAYALLAIVMMIIGFLVMFRKKIDPKTVVTVQSALPKIVTTLILITFSYAIVGIMIDLMYLVIALIVTLFVSAIPAPFVSQNVLSNYMNGGVWQVFDILWGGTKASKDIAILLVGDNGWAGVSSLLVGLLISIGVLFVFVRIIIMLLTAYIQIILALITAPIQFLLDAIPGGNGFGAWMKNFLSNLLVFPVTAVMLLLGTILIQFYESGSGTIWTPPFLGGANISAGSLTSLIGIGVLLSLPNIVKGLQESLKAKPMFNAGLGGDAFSGATKVGTGLIQGAYYVSMIKNAFPGKTDSDKPGNPNLDRQQVGSMIKGDNKR